MNPTMRPPVAKSIVEVLQQLDDIIEICLSEKSWLAAFAIIYRQTTARIKSAIENGDFQDNQRMELLDVTFANLYIAAYYNYREGNKTTLPWRLAFTHAKSRLAIAQHITLGMNAHINSDLAVAAATIAHGADIIHLKSDFIKINEILASLTDQMQKELGKISLSMRLLDWLGLRTDEKIINFSIAKARDFAWHNAMELALLDNQAANVLKTTIDQKIEKLGEKIVAPTGIIGGMLRIIRLAETHDPGKLTLLMN